MPKDRERSRYIEVGLERDSWVLAKFEEDAKKHQSKQPGKLIALRLTEYYEMKEREAFASRGPLPAVVQGEASPIRLIPTQQAGSAQTDALEVEIVEPSQHMVENADDAAEYWSAM